jgi:hypothetical protein
MQLLNRTSLCGPTISIAPLLHTTLQAGVSRTTHPLTVVRFHPPIRPPAAAHIHPAKVLGDQGRKRRSRPLGVWFPKPAAASGCSWEEPAAPVQPDPPVWSRGNCTWRPRRSYRGILGLLRGAPGSPRRRNGLAEKRVSLAGTKQAGPYLANGGPDGEGGTRLWSQLSSLRPAKPVPTPPPQAPTPSGPWPDPAPPEKSIFWAP